MAVVQISRIQVRRGKADTTGVPQLASGELGWAIDDQQLWIGNGAVSEGAPAVGNTRILTDNDGDVLLAAKYVALRGIVNTSADAGSDIEIDLEDRLDEQISVKSFGAVGNGLTDDTAALQRAIDQLYLIDSRRGDVDSRIALYFPAGTYKITDSLKVPSYATLIGAGIDKTILAPEDCGAFVTVGGDSTPGSYVLEPAFTEDSQPTNINIKGFTMSCSTYDGAMQLNSVKDSVFEEIKITGDLNGEIDTGIIVTGAGTGEDPNYYYLPNEALLDSGQAYVNYHAINISSKSASVFTNQNTYTNIYISGFVDGIYSDDDIISCEFRNIKIKDCVRGMIFGEDITLGDAGQFFGFQSNNINNCVFEDIYRYAVHVAEGKYNTLHSNRYIAVGNEGGASVEAEYPIVRFARLNNVSYGDYFERAFDTLGGNASGNPAVADVRGDNGLFEKQHYPINIFIGVAPESNTIFNLPVQGTTGTYVIDYWFYVDAGDDQIIRKGTLKAVYNSSLPEVVTEDAQLIVGEDPLDGESFTIDAEFAYLTDPASNDSIRIFADNLYSDTQTSDFKFMVTHYS
jgi:hypothetical protein